MKTYYMILASLFLAGGLALLYVGEIDRALIGLLFFHVYKLKSDGIKNV